MVLNNKLIGWGLISTITQPNSRAHLKPKGISLKWLREMDVFLTQKLMDRGRKTAAYPAFPNMPLLSNKTISLKGLIPVLSYT